MIISKKGYDLSKVMFIATSNNMAAIQPALQTVEIIKMSGYTIEEKVEVHVSICFKTIEKNMV
jgi:ATP-dependent Lon protease